MKLQKIYFKRRLLRGIIYFVQNLPDWARYYFMPILYPFLTAYVGRKTKKVKRAVNAIRKGTATEEQFLAIISSMYHFGLMVHRAEMRVLHKTAARQLYHRFLSSKAAYAMVKLFSEFYFKENYFTESEVREFRSMKMNCFYEIGRNLNNRDEIKKFLEKFRSDKDFPENMKRDLSVKFLKLMSPKHVIEEMIDLQKGFLRLGIHRDEELKELYETRLKRLASLNFTEEEAEKVFEAFQDEIEHAKKFSAYMFSQYGYNQENYESFIFEEAERENFKKHAITGEYLLSKKIDELVSVWSQSRFNEMLTPEQFFDRKREDVTKLSV